MGGVGVGRVGRSCEHRTLRVSMKMILCGRIWKRSLGWVQGKSAYSVKSNPSASVDYLGDIFP